jgi:hypothetical protein
MHFNAFLLEVKIKKRWGQTIPHPTEGQYMIFQPCVRIFDFRIVLLEVKQKKLGASHTFLAPNQTPTRAFMFTPLIFAKLFSKSSSK